MDRYSKRQVVAFYRVEETRFNVAKRRLVPDSELLQMGQRTRCPPYSSKGCSPPRTATGKIFGMPGSHNQALSLIITIREYVQLPFLRDQAWLGRVSEVPSTTLKEAKFSHINPSLVANHTAFDHGRLETDAKLRVHQIMLCGCNLDHR